jgi:hypothetical protein
MEKEKKERRKEEKLTDMLCGVQLERDEERLRKMKDSELKVQLHLWKKRLPQRKITITMPRAQKILVLVAIIKANDEV